MKTEAPANDGARAIFHAGMALAGLLLTSEVDALQAALIHLVADDPTGRVAEAVQAVIRQREGSL